jgi:phage terminase large subunit-like protein
MPQTAINKTESNRDPATAYAESVVAGEIVTGKYARLACERHLKDLETGKNRGLYFDPEAAQIAIDFWQMCPHLKGSKWAGENIKLEPWQCFIIGSVYGWKKKGGLRRFRICWIECARKNGKTTTLYPAALFALAVECEPGAEVYSFATKRDQAKIVYNMARRAVLKSDDLLDIITPFVHHLEVEEDGSKFEAIGADADTADGLNPNCAICDETHKWKGRSLWDVIESGMGAREEPIMWSITTAGEEGDEDVYGQEHDYGVQVLEGVIEDDSRFCIIFAIDDEDDWTDSKNIVKANPNLGVSVEKEEIEGAIRKAQKNPASANGVKRLRLGRRAQSDSSWIPLEIWKRLKIDFDVERLRGFSCYAGLDLASSSDFAAKCKVFPLTADMGPSADLGSPDLWYFDWTLWIPREGHNWREGKLREIVRPWIEQGYVIETEGDVIDHDVIEKSIIGDPNTGIVGDAENYDLRGVAFDPFNATQLSTRLGFSGIDMRKFPQNLTSFSEPTKRFAELVAGGKLRHNGNPCISWMIRNAVVMENGAGHQMPARKKSKNKIDGLVAAVMGLGRAIADEGVSTGNFYDTNGVEMF